MVEANIRVHRWILISRVRDVDAAEARFFVNALSGLFLISTTRNRHILTLEHL